MYCLSRTFGRISTVGVLTGSPSKPPSLHVCWDCTTVKVSKAGLVPLWNSRVPCSGGSVMEVL
ncbi:hypothetical protein FBU30_005196 [Linnemannia zychae]|nr:hypothetical protein FBU30_005196 [Linnemannia zychae]